MTSTGSLIFHALAAVNFYVGCYYDWNYVKIPKHVIDMGDYAGKLKFLTYWDAILQAVFFTVCVLNDIFGTNERHPKKTPFIRRIKDLLLPSLAFPMAMFVATTFWGLYFVDRELVFPKVLDPYFPSWLNHNMHTSIAVFIMIELLTSYRNYPSRKVGLTILIIFNAIYLVWLHVIFNKSGRWVYPILAVLNLPLRIVFFAFSLILSTGLYIIGEKINSLRWNEKPKLK